MGKFIIAVLVLLVLIGGVAIYFSPDAQEQREHALYVQSEHDRLALEAAQQQAQIQAQRAQTLAPVVTGVQTSLIVVIALVAALAVAAGAMFCFLFLARRLVLVRPNAQGVLPMPLVGFDRLAEQSGASIGLFHAANIQRAIHQPGQTPASFAPHITYSPHHERHGLPDSVAGQPLLDLDQVLGVPTFAELLDQGRIGRGMPLLLGVDEQGQEVSGSWLDLYSTIVSGLPGSGKTTSQRFLACQTALQGARFVVVDPHAGAADDSLAATLQPLSRAFLCEPASDDKAILSAVQLVADIGERRVKGKDTSTYPVILWLDETTKLLSRSTVAGPLAKLIEGIAQEYRKKSVFACASGQIWSASRTGDDSALRDSFASVLCHRMKRSQARLLIPTEEAQTVERLGTGQAVLWRTSGETSVISVPNTTAQDVQRVAGLLTDSGSTLATLLATPVANVKPVWSHFVATSVAIAKPDSSQMVANDEWLYTASQSEKGTSPEAARAAALFLDGASLAEVVRELRSVGSNEGGRYQKALNEVQELLRDGLRAA